MLCKLPPQLRCSSLFKRDSCCDAVSVRWCFSWSVGADRRVCPECHCYRLIWADTPVRPYVRMFSTRIVGTRHAVSAWCYQTPSASLVPLRKEGQLLRCRVPTLSHRPHGRYLFIRDILKLPPQLRCGLTALLWGAKAKC